MNNASKILLVHAPFRSFGLGDDWQKTDSLAPPLGLMYLAAPLVKSGYTVKFIDFNVDRLTRTQFNSLIKESKYIGISCYTDSLLQVKEIIKYIRHVKKNAYILCGGPYCNLTANFIPGADLVTVGEAEKYISEIFHRLETNQSLKSIPGLLYRQGKKIIHQPGMMQVDNLNESLLPELSLAKGKDYGHFFGLQISGLTGTMSSRGCSFHCHFCTSRGTGYKERSVENVVTEMKLLVALGYKYVIFYDDNFLVNKTRVSQIIQRLIDENINLKIFCQGRVDSADPTFYQLLRKGGVSLIMFGIENSNQDVLDFYNKAVKIETIKKAITLANKVGIFTFGHVIIGAPMETRAYFDRTSQFVDDVKLDFMNLNILGYYQGAKLWQDQVDKGAIKPNETIVWANEKLSHFTYQQLLDVKGQMLQHFYHQPIRIFRIVKKIILLGELPIFFTVLFKLNRNLLKVISNPFTPKKEVAKILVNT